MKEILTLLFIGIFLINTCKSQSIEASYNVVHSGDIPLGNGETKSYSLDYKGVIYHLGDSTIAFLKPLYLLDYPDGKIIVPTPTGESVMALRVDSVQSVTLYNNDTIVKWNIESSIGSIPKRLIIHQVKKGTPFYKFFDDSKTINGLLCKHAFLYYPNSDKPWADIWYYPGYQLPYSFFGIGNLPGLLVKGDFYTLNYTFELVSLKTNEPIDESIFMPEYFLQDSKKDIKYLQRQDSIRRKKNEIMSQ